MPLSRKSRVTLIVMVAILVFLLLWALYYFLTKPKFFPTGGPSPAANLTLPAANTNQVPTAVMTTPATNQVLVSRLAADFAERFGSYSSQSGAVNLEELKKMATKRMQQTLESLRRSQKVNVNAAYQGVTTKALTPKVSRLTTNSAAVVVPTQRQETTATGQTVVKYQKITLNLLKVGGSWLVDEARWQ